MSVTLKDVGAAVVLFTAGMAFQMWFHAAVSMVHVWCSQ
jgi:hypothetical protein